MLALPNHKLLIMVGIRICAGVAFSLVQTPPSDADPTRSNCSDVQVMVDNYSQSIPNPILLKPLTPYMTARAMPALLAQLPRADAETRQAIYLAVGGSRHSESLRLLTKLPRPEDSGDRIALAVALLALGDASRTATISRALQLGSVSERRMVSRALSQMKQVRPTRSLRRALHDVDDVVRLAAVSSLGHSQQNLSRKILMELTKSDKLDVRLQAANLLVKRRHRLKYEALMEQPEPMRSKMYVIAASRRTSQVIGRLKTDVMSKDRLRRSASLASMAHVMPFRRFRRIQKRLRGRYGKEVKAELAMTLSLYDEEAGWATLDKLDRNELEQAIAVMAAYVGVGSRQAGLSIEQAQRFANRFEVWMLTGILSESDEHRVFEALMIMEPNVVLALARNRLSQKDGEGLRTALNILGQRGEAMDIPNIVAVLKGKPSAQTRIAVLIAAAKLCRY